MNKEQQAGLGRELGIFPAGTGRGRVPAPGWVPAASHPALPQPSPAPSWGFPSLPPSAPPAGVPGPQSSRERPVLASWPPGLGASRGASSLRGSRVLTPGGALGWLSALRKAEPQVREIEKKC